jgi:hypothetical protein
MEWQISNSVGYKGKASGEREVNVEISLEKTNLKTSVRRLFSAELDVSLCYIEQTRKALRQSCGCSVDADEIHCSLHAESENFSSMLTISRKTAIAKILQKREIGKKDSELWYTVSEHANVQCKVFEENKF